jgi:hypothetical protein
MANVKHLLEPLLDGGVRSTNWFNGRVLTAEDLRADQDANRQQRQLLARAVGQGVLTGLEVTRAGSNSVAVTQGEAINSVGQVLVLGGTDPIALEIVPDAAAGGAPVQRGAFSDCSRQAVTAVNTGYGLYLLVAGPAGGFEGSAPSTGTTGDGKITGCGSRYAVEGIQFRLAHYLGEESLGEDTARMRNLVAHDFFGTTDESLQDLFAARTAYGEMDRVRADKVISSGEVPLALVYWTAQGVAWVDMWAVRRRVAPALSGPAWDALVGPRRQAEAEAVFLQFQEDLAAYVKSSDAVAPALRSRFRYLPPFGYLPVGSEGGGEWLYSYLEGCHWMRVWPDPAFLRSMLQKAALVEPVDLEEETEYPTLGVYWESGMKYAVFFRKGRGTRATARV